LQVAYYFSLILVASFPKRYRIALIDELLRHKINDNVPELPGNYISALEALILSEKEKQFALDTVAKCDELIEKKDDMIVAASDLNIEAEEVSIEDFVENMEIEGLGISNLFVWLIARAYLDINGSPYCKYVERGYFVSRPYAENNHNRVKYPTLLAPKGTLWLAKIVRAEFELEHYSGKNEI